MKADICRHCGKPVMEVYFVDGVAWLHFDGDYEGSFLCHHPWADWGVKTSECATPAQGVVMVREEEKA